MMKNLTKIFMSVVVAMFAISCVTDATEDLGVKIENAASQSEITISLEESRTQLGEKADGKYPVYWSEGDAILVNGNVSAPLTATQANSASATFSLKGELTYPYNIVYPGVADAEAAANNTYPVTFLAEQAYTEGTFCAGAAPMYGYVAEADDKIQMHHLTGVLCIAVKGNGEALTSVVAKSELGKIAGPFTVNCTNGTLTAQEGSSKTVTVTFDEPLVLGAEAQNLYIAVPAGNYGTFAVTLKTASDKMTVKFNSTTSPISAGNVRVFKEFTYAANDVDDGGNVFEIDGKDALMEFAGLVSAGTFAETYTAAAVVANIDMTGEAWEPIEGFDKSIIDGGNYTINGLTAPLFGTTTSTIMNINLTNVNIASNGRLVVGAVACVLAEGEQSSISNCKVSGTITVSNPNATIESGATKYSTVNIAGVVGTTYGNVDNCVNEANITVNQVASSDNTVVVHPVVGGVVGYSLGGGVTNCVNGNEAKTTGAIKYLDNQAAQLYTPHVAGIAGMGVNTNASPFKGNTNYGAIEFNANAAGTGELDYNSTSIAGVIAQSCHEIENNNNYGAITISGGKIKAFVVGGVIGTSKPAKLINCHNHQGANITVDSDVAFWGISVAGVVASYQNSSVALDNCTNDAPILVKASTDTNATAGSQFYYRVGGVITYANYSVHNCENKANGDITVEGNVTLLRSNNQPGYAVVGVSCYHTTDGTSVNLINRGDINVYTNVTPFASWNTTKTHQTYGKIDIAGISGYDTKAKRDFQNYGNITIGKTDSAISITGNGIHIGGLASYFSNTISVTNLAKNINAGKITINKVTFNGKFSPTAEDTANTWSTHIGGIAGYPTGAISKSENSGAITVSSGATFSSETSIGGAVGYATNTLTSVNNTANVTVAGKMSALGYVAGGVGLTAGAITTSSNSGAVSVSTTNSATTYVAGYAGYIIAAKDTKFNGISNTGDVTFSGNSGSNTLALGGAIGANKNAGAYSNCSNNGVVTLTKGAKAQKVHYVGGLIGYSVANSSYTSCTNSTKTGVEWGIVIHQTASTTSSGCAKRIGGLIGNAGTTTLNNVSNSAGIYHDGCQLGTAGLSIGGIGGTMGASTTVSGVIENSGDIYYAGRCPKSNFGIAGIFATPGNSTLTGATIINTGDITIEKKYDDFIPTDNGSHRCVLGGITGYAPTALANATSYCTISIPDWRAESGTAANNNYYGAIQGINTPTNHITKCNVGGSIIANDNAPGVLTVSNYAPYLTGAQSFPTASAKTQECGVITSIDDTTPEYAE